MKLKIGFAAAGLAAASAFAMVGPASAADLPDQITFIIPYSPGGGFDTYVRELSPIMEKYLPKGTNVLPKNIDGAGGRKAAAKLYRADPDGSLIEIFNIPGMLLDKILGKPAPYKMEKFVWLARVARSPYVLGVSTKSPYNSIDDLKRAKELKYPVTSPSSTAYVAGKIMASILGLDVKFLPGYKGSSKTALSIIRGDTDLSLFAERSYAKYASGGDLKALLYLDEKSPFEGVPTASSIGHPELNALATGRFVGTTPGTPKDIVKALETALLKAMNDPKAQAWSKKSKRPINPLNSEETTKRIHYLIDYFMKYHDALAAK